MKAVLYTSFMLSCSFVSMISAQQTEPDRERQAREGREFREGERRGGGDRFRGLSAEERDKVRDAFDKVWVRPEVKKAREELRIANESYRRTIEQALKSVDPEAAEILARTRPTPMHHQLPIAQATPQGKDEDAVQSALGDIQKQLSEFLQKSRIREGDAPLSADEIHPKILQNEQVSQALASFKASSDEEGKQKWEEFRIAYLDQLVTFLPRRGGGMPQPPPRGPRRAEEGTPQRFSPGVDP